MNLPALRSALARAVRVADSPLSSLATRAWRLGRSVATGTLPIRGKRVRVRRAYGPDVWRSLVAGSYEATELRLVDDLWRDGLMARGDRVLELGSSLGVMLMHLASLAGDECVVGVEANAMLVSEASTNFASNGHRLRLIHAAVVAEGAGGTATLHHRRDVWGASVVPGSGVVRSEQVPAITLSSLLFEVAPRLLVVDIEGGEFELFVRTPTLGSVAWVVCEIHPERVDPGAATRLVQRFAELGFDWNAERTRENVLVFGRRAAT